MLRSACVVAVVLWGCGGGSSPAPARPAVPGPGDGWSSALLAHVPADTPYVFASLDNHPANLGLGATAKRRFARAVAKLEHQPGTGVNSAAIRGMRAVLAEMTSTDPRRWPVDLGFAPDARYVLYGLGYAPVVRAEVGDAAHLRQVIDHVIAALGAGVSTHTHPNGQVSWTYARAGLTIVIAVDAKELVAAMLPTVHAAELMPLVLGAQLPKSSLRDSRVLADERERYHFTGAGLGYLDVRLLAEDLVAASGLDEPAACKADLARLTDLAPRVAVGFTRLDRESFSASLALELAPAAAAALQKLHSNFLFEPADDAIFTFAGAVDLDAAVALARSILQGVHDRPFTCPWDTFGQLNAAADEGLRALPPLPPMAQGLRGVGVSARATAELDGHVAVAGTTVVSTAKMLLGAMPGLVRGAATDDGAPFELSPDVLGLKQLESAAAAMQGDRVVAVGGPDALRRAARLVGKTGVEVPLFWIAVDPGRVKQRFPRLLEGDDDEDIRDFRYIDMRFEADGTSLRVDLTGTWK